MKDRLPLETTLPRVIPVGFLVNHDSTVFRLPVCYCHPPHMTGVVVFRRRRSRHGGTDEGIGKGEMRDM